MGKRWRIRHKLMLGLGLVVLLMALLLSGTLRGLWSYYTTVNNVRAKLDELEDAHKLNKAIARLTSQGTLADLVEKPWLLRELMTESRQAVNAYRQQLEVNRQRGEVEDSHEVELLEVLDANLDAFERLAPELAAPRTIGPAHDDLPRDPEKALIRLEGAYRDQILAGLAQAAVADSPLNAAAFVVLAEVPPRDLPLRRVVAETLRNAEDLRGTIHQQLERYLSESRRHYQISLWIIVPASVVGLLSMAGLMRSFYSWVFNPIRDLAGGVSRVAQGDFESRIDLKSGDEMEDLAAAFNEMMQRLKDLYADLARQVNERSRQLVRSERLASVGYLAAGVAHEINNPLHSIALCSEALESRLAELVKALRLGPAHARELEVIYRYLRMIQEEAFRCKEITERLLEFSRPGERKRETTDLVALVQAVVEGVQVLPHARGKTITLEAATERVPGGKIKAVVNAEEVRSVLLNLAINAMESMEEGGRLHVVVSQRGGMAELCFTDTGCGMTAEVLENIFEPFFTRSRTGKGTGLGLTISHRIIQQHGGDIEASSAGPGQGSTFVVRLPLAEAVPVPAERRAA